MARDFHTYSVSFFLRVSLVLLLVCSARQVAATPKVKPFRQLSRPEKVWAVLHPFKAKKSYACALRARIVTDSLEKAGVFTDRTGGQLDAFRHAYWMALMINVGLKEETVRTIGEKHEKGNYLDFRKGNAEDSIVPDSMSCVMDLKNNEKGIELGKQFRDGDKKISLINLIIIQIWNGKLFILKKDENGNYMDCEGKYIDLNKFIRIWSIPKCLVGSDQIAVSH